MGKPFCYTYDMMKQQGANTMWNKEGQRVVGRYLGLFNVSGLVSESRVKYGGSVQHRVELDEAITVFGRHTEVLLLDDTELVKDL
jgi:hypothetical protein